MRRESFVYVACGIFFISINFVQAESCKAVSTHETCTSPTTKIVTYTYSHASCGNDYIQQERDTNCQLQVTIPIEGKLCNAATCYTATLSIDSTRLFVHGHLPPEPITAANVSGQYITQYTSSTSLFIFPGTKRVFAILNDLIFFGTISSDYLTYYLLMIL